METRLTYVRWQMDNILSDPTIKVSMLNKGTSQTCKPMSVAEPVRTGIAMSSHRIPEL